MGLGKKLLLTLLICSFGIGLNGHLFDQQLCPMNAAMCGWNYLEHSDETFCYKFYANPASAKVYNRAVAQCEAMSQVKCKSEMINATDMLISALMDDGLANGTYYVNKDPGALPAILEIVGSTAYLTENPTPEELDVKRAFICKACATPRPTCPNCCNVEQGI